MSDFYSNLAKDALAGHDHGDADSDDEDDVDVSKIIGDMDDLDASLFGTSIGSIKQSSAPIPVPSLETTKYSSPHTSLLSNPADISSAKQEKPSNKSRLLAELFGDDASPQSNKQNIEVKTKLPDNNTTQTDFSSLSYQPTTERRRRPMLKPSASEDLWSTFLKDNASHDNSEITIPKKSIDHVPTPSYVTNSPEKNMKHEIANQVPMKSLSQTAIESLHKSEQVQQNWIKSNIPENKKSDPVLTPEQQFELLKPFIEEMIKSNVSEIFSETQETSAKIENLEIKHQELSNSQLSSHKMFEGLADQILDLQNRSKDVEQQISEDYSQLCEKIKLFESVLKKEVHSLEGYCSGEISTLQINLSSLEQQIQNTKDRQKKMEEKNLQDVFQEKHLELCCELEKLRSGLVQDIRDTNSKISILERQCSSLNTKLQEQLEEQEVNMTVLDTKCKQLALNKRSATWEEDLELRIDRTESNFESRLLHSNKQQARASAWQERQISDLADFMDQRLWSLHDQLELQRKEICGQRSLVQSALEPCSEAANLRKQIHSIKSGQENAERNLSVKMSSLETRVTNTESENFRLSRLADRLCGLLQMWEQRHKEASKSESVSLQSLEERYNMAIVEMTMNKMK